MSVRGDLIAVGVAGVVLLAAAWYAKKKLADAGAAVTEVISDAWEASTEAVWQGAQVIDRSAAWPILKAGDAIGIPRTNETECAKALREGRNWDASFACPAGTFIGSWFE